MTAKKNHPSVVPGIVLAMFLAITSTVPDASAIVSDKSRTKSAKLLSPSKKQKSEQSDNSESQTQNKESAQQLNKIIESAKSYKDNPSTETYTELWKNFESWIHGLVAKHVDASATCKSCQALSKAGLKIIDVAGSGGTVKIYTFSPQMLFTQNKPSPAGQPNNIKSELKPLVSSTPQTTIDSRDFVIQSADSAVSEISPRYEKHGRNGKSKRARLRTRRLRKVSTLHAQSVNIPANVEIKQAYLLTGAASKARFLALIGLDLQSGHAWTDGLKHTGTSWAQNADLWQQVPSFLLQTGQAKLRLSENNLVITIGGRGAADNTDSSGSYELVMPFVENHFALTRNEAQDPAKAVALQFLLAVQGKRADLAKIWLTDPQLASIPGYLGLYNRPAGSSFLKLINMSPPLTGGARFRIITGTKDDLILDVGKFKGQWLVKAVFIAPADSLAKEIGRFVQATGQ